MEEVDDCSKVDVPSMKMKNMCICSKFSLKCEASHKNWDSRLIDVKISLLGPG